MVPSPFHLPRLTIGGPSGAPSSRSQAVCPDRQIHLTSDSLLAGCPQLSCEGLSPSSLGKVLSLQGGLFGLIFPHHQLWGQHRARNTPLLRPCPGLTHNTAAEQGACPPTSHCGDQGHHNPWQAWPPPPPAPSPGVCLCSPKTLVQRSCPTMAQAARTAASPSRLWLLKASGNSQGWAHPRPCR